MDREPLFFDLDALFSPRSVAIIGLPQGMKTGKLFLIALQDMGFPGPIYPVNPKAEVIDGLKCYPSVSAIADPVDLAIVLVGRQFAPEVVRQCATRGVKGVVLFTSGYRETGTDEGRRIEAEMVETARAAGMRLFGPNCMGLYAPRTGLSFFPGLSRTPGHLGLISHSGSLANIIGRLAEDKGLAFSKVVSLGNEADLHSADFLAYLAEDEETRVIGGYLEGIKDGPYFLRTLKRAASKKPVVLWKVGLTPEGGRAAASHTGALAGSEAIWRGVVNQCNAVSVAGWDQWLETMMAFYLLPPTVGKRVAIISGPGGLAVSAAEAVGRCGLKLADLAASTQTELARHVPPTGTSLANPIDVSLNAHMDLTIFTRAAELATADPGVDAVVVIGSGLDEEANKQYAASMIEVRGQTGKPFLMVAIPGMPPETGRAFCRAGLPFFDTAEKAMAAYARVVGYYARRCG
ncbi:MAG: CoA-binding protein [Desulfobacterales bacterium]|nr:CoA-binding protein [Desulfobacterales bacterium]